jgi:predicted RNA binding protein YcfA (HicA-like mRNA interferase family)
MSRELLQLLRANGLQLVRQRKHQIFRHSASGRKFVAASSPSDFRAELNVRAELRRFLRSACGGGV